VEGSLEYLSVLLEHSFAVPEVIQELPSVLAVVAYRFRARSLFGPLAPLSLVGVAVLEVLSLSVVHIHMVASLVGALLLVVYVLPFALKPVVHEVALIAEFVGNVVLSVTLLDPLHQIAFEICTVGV
jgi:hypothetical protein